MSKPIVLAQRFDKMVRDGARNNMPTGACWGLYDWIPGELDAPLGKRGGFSYESNALTGILSGADLVDSVIYAPFTGGAQLLAVPVNTGVSARLAQIVSSSSTTDRGLVGQPFGPMAFYRNKVYIPNGAGTSAPYVYDGTTNASVLTGSPPSGKHLAIYKDRLVLAGTSAEPQRLYFSGGGDATEWDTVTRWWDTSGEIRGIYSLRNAILIWHPGFMERIIGSIPPPGSDMALQPLSDVGLGDFSSWSFAGTDEFVCFASDQGVHLTDGASVADLTEQGGFKSYWQDVVAPNSNGVYSGGFFRGYYFCAPNDGTEVYVVHVASRRWFTFTNIDARCFARKTGADEELFFGMNNTARVASLGSVFDPQAANKNDADGTAVNPVLETPYYDLGQSKSTVRKVFFNYDLRDAASDNPTMTASYILSPELTSYTDVVGQTGAAYPLTKLLERDRVRRLIRKPTFGIAFKLTQNAASASTRIYSIETEAHGREDSRV